MFGLLIRALKLTFRCTRYCVLAGDSLTVGNTIRILRAEEDNFQFEASRSLRVFVT
jgi:hypothetical protein